ncbi:response regulator transcription factor [Luteolibacter sp. SL250]|uniref:response regulator transcription factor n=1 Tax=Luteolibacter sp. SL250 TaxID=2995170 RepID=UPI00226EDBEF|nr:response regulator transcription factor [Luteolibacter sp. SL250]WAC20342.1 response regulator transcription factor [Luteolibacter sp. SL250]
MSASPVIRLLLADDHYIVLMGLKSLLKLRKEFKVVATAGDGEEAVALFREHQPDIALLDLRMPKLDGIQATGRIRKEFPGARVILLTSFDREEEIHQAVKAGVAGYLLKESKLPELSEAIRTVFRGERWFPKEILDLAKERASLPELSKREVEVLDLVAKGLTNKEIAGVLGFSEDGAKHHLRKIYEKLGVNVRAEAISEALRRGILRE